MGDLMLKIWAAIAIHWLKKDYRSEKKELIATKHFILKAERKSNPGDVKLTRTFSIHRFMYPGEVGPGPAWWYDKYLVDEDCKYTHLRSGKYPYSWE